MQKLDPYLNVDPGHDEPVPARRGLRHRRRRRDRPRHRSLRALPRRQPRGQRQRDDRPGLQPGHRQGAARRVPRRHRPGHPAHHQRDQGADARRSPTGGRGRRRTSSSPRSAARSATSSRCRSSRRPARCATTSAATTCFFLHVSLVPYLAPSGELKTKPTQHSVAALRQVGIQPDALVLRADREIPDAIKRKISLMCDVDVEAVAAAVDAPSIYDIPKVLHREGLDAYVIRRLGLTFRDVDWTDWDQLLAARARPRARGRDRPRRQVHRPARRLPLGHRGAARRRLPPRRQGRASAGSPATSARPRPAPSRRSAGSTPSSCPAASACAASRASSARCTWAREQAGAHPRHLPRACSAWSSSTPATSPASRARARPSSTPRRRHPVIATMEEQKAFVEGAGDLGGTMRLGLLPGQASSRARSSREAYGATDGRGAPPPPLRGQQLLPRRRSRRPGLVFSRHLARRRRSSSSSSCRARCTPTTCRRRRTPSSCRARTGRTRCSPGSSAPPSSASARRGWSRSSARGTDETAEAHA